MYTTKVVCRVIALPFSHVVVVDVDVFCVVVFSSCCYFCGWLFCVCLWGDFVVCIGLFVFYFFVVLVCCWICVFVVCCCVCYICRRVCMCACVRGVGMLLVLYNDWCVGVLCL